MRPTKPQRAQTRKPLTVKRLVKPMILREHVAKIDHPAYGTVQVSRAFMGCAIIFEFPNEVYHVVDLHAIADEVFEQIEEGGGKP